MSALIRDAIWHAAAAAKLRAFVRKNGSYFQAMERIADRHSNASTSALGRWLAECGRSTGGNQ